MLPEHSGLVERPKVACKGAGPWQGEPVLCSLVLLGASVQGYVLVRWCSWRPCHLEPLQEQPPLAPGSAINSTHPYKAPGPSLTFMTLQTHLQNTCAALSSKPRLHTVPQRRWWQISVTREKDHQGGEDHVREVVVEFKEVRHFSVKPRAESRMKAFMSG